MSKAIIIAVGAAGVFAAAYFGYLFVTVPAVGFNCNGLMVNGEQVVPVFPYKINVFWSIQADSKGNVALFRCGQYISSVGVKC